MSDQETTPNPSPADTAHIDEVKAEAEAEAAASPQPEAQSKPANDPALAYLDDAQRICVSLEKSFRRAYGDMPNQADLAEIHGQQAAIKDLVHRALESGAGAQDKLAKLTRERDRFQDAAVRAKADFLNYQERSRRDMDRAEESALRGYVSDLLPILDSLDLALADAKSENFDPGRFRSAVEMIATSFQQVLKVRGLERIVAAGQVFDPNLHQAVCTRPIEAAKGEGPNQVIEELRPGYTWKGKLLRPCQVLITEPKSAQAAKDDG